MAIHSLSITGSWLGALVIVGVVMIVSLPARSEMNQRLVPTVHLRNGAN